MLRQKKGFRGDKKGGKFFEPTNGKHFLAGPASFCAKQFRSSEAKGNKSFIKRSCPDDFLDSERERSWARRERDRKATI